jgi:type IV pilus assembly protein PilO
MTVTGDFLPEENQQQTAPEYPTAFGIPLSPTVIGVVIGVLGLVGAVYLVVRVLMPALENAETLQNDIAAKEQQLANQAGAQQQIDAAEDDLEAALAQRAAVYSLFASSETLDTLIIDINQQITPTNAGIQDRRQRLIQAGADPDLVGARLAGFIPQEDESGVITDGTYGPEVDGKLERQVVEVQLQGDFNQIQSIIRNMERLEPLLLLQDFNMEVSDINEEFSDIVGTQILDTTFSLVALTPTGSPDELPTIQPPQPPAEGEQTPPAQ